MVVVTKMNGKPYRTADYQNLNANYLHDTPRSHTLHFYKMSFHRVKLEENKHYNLYHANGGITTIDAHLGVTVQPWMLIQDVLMMLIATSPTCTSVNDRPLYDASVE